MKLNRLRSGPRATPLFRQAQIADCGLACLAMVAAHHAGHTDLNAIRQQLDTSPRGVNIGQLARAASTLGLSARPLKAEIHDLPNLRLPAVLHWDLEHFVVLVAVKGGKALIHDPTRGAMRMPMADVSAHFTGVCLELSPRIDFCPPLAAPRISVLRLFGGLQGAREAIVQVMLMAVALEGFAVVSPLFMQLVVDQAAVSADRGLLAVLSLGFLLLAVIQVSVAAARAWLVTVMGSTLSLQVLSNLFVHLLRLPMQFFEMRQMGDIMARFESLNVIQRTLTSAFVEALIDGLMVMVTLAVMLVYSPMLAGVVVAAAIAYTLVRVLLFAPMRRAQSDQIAQSARQHSSFIESVRGIQSVKLFNRQSQRASQYTNMLVASTNDGIRVQGLAIGSQAAKGAISSVENIAVVWLGATLVIDGVLSLGMLFAFVAFKQQFANRTSAFVDKLVDLRMMGLHAERFGEIALAKAETRHDLPDPDALVPSVELRNVSFRYSAHEPYVLRHVNLRVEPGESVAIVGPSGCGKSTLVRLVLGLLEPTEGQVLIGGVDIAGLGVGYRDSLGAVMQSDELFSGSIAENISFFDAQVDLSRVETCARAAAIEADILAMPMRYSTMAGEMGTTLSGGQKQRLLLARALYKRPSILVLDEATSHLDSARERSVNEAVRALDVTRIIVAHRAETIATAQRVVSLEQVVPADARPSAKGLAVRRGA